MAEKGLWHSLAMASLGRIRLQILRRRRRTLCISLLPGTVGTSRVFVVPERESIGFLTGLAA